MASELSSYGRNYLNYHIHKCELKVQIGRDKAPDRKLVDNRRATHFTLTEVTNKFVENRCAIYIQYKHEFTQLMNRFCLIYWTVQGNSLCNWGEFVRLCQFHLVVPAVCVNFDRKKRSTVTNCVVNSPRPGTTSRLFVRLTFLLQLKFQLSFLPSASESNMRQPAATDSGTLSIWCEKSRSQFRRDSGSWTFLFFLYTNQFH